MKKEATKEELLQYLLSNEDYLKITAIGKAIGCNKLLAIVKGYPTGKGYATPLPDKYVSALRDWVKNHQYV